MHLGKLVELPTALAAGPLPLRDGAPLEDPRKRRSTVPMRVTPGVARSLVAVDEAAKRAGFTTGLRISGACRWSGEQEGLQRGWNLWVQAGCPLPGSVRWRKEFSTVPERDWTQTPFSWGAAVEVDWAGMLWPTWGRPESFSSRDLARIQAVIDAAKGQGFELLSGGALDVRKPGWSMWRPGPLSDVANGVALDMPWAHEVGRVSMGMTSSMLAVNEHEIRSRLILGGYLPVTTPILSAKASLSEKSVMRALQASGAIPEAQLRAWSAGRILTCLVEAGVGQQRIDAL